MDGLAATLAAIACAYFAVDAASGNSSDLVLVVALSLCLACIGFLPFNLRPGRAGGRVHGRLGQPAARFHAGGARARVELDGRRDDRRDDRAAAARARDPDPRHGVRHAAPDRAAAAGEPGRPRPHLAPARLLRPLRDAGGGAAGRDRDRARCDRRRLQHPQRRPRDSDRRARHRRPARAVRELPQRPRGARAERVDGGPALAPARAASSRGGSPRCSSTSGSCAAPSSPRTCSSSAASAPASRRPSSSAALPVVLVLRYLGFVVGGIYRRVWRFAGVHDAVAVAVACGLSALAAYVVVVCAAATWARSREQVFLLDAVFATVLVLSARVTVGRLLQRARRRLAGGAAAGPRGRRRAAPVGASPASCARRRASARSPSSTTTRASGGGGSLGVVVAGALDEAEPRSRRTSRTRWS